MVGAMGVGLVPEFRIYGEKDYRDFVDIDAGSQEEALARGQQALEDHYGGRWKVRQVIKHPDPVAHMEEPDDNQES